MEFEIKLPLFSGPFDLLLFFIERDELNINDIPISKITNDFLEYIHHLEKMNIEIASEFILVAASLMRIKAKMLIPRPDLDDKGDEIDPREELVSRLLEYKKYKSVLDELRTLEETRLTKEKRGNVEAELKKLAESQDVEAELESLDLYKLLKVFQNVSKRFELNKSKPDHKVVQYAFTVDGQKQYITDKLTEQDKLSFVEIIEDNPDKIWLIFNFLSILELLQLKLILIQIGEGYNNFWLSPNPNYEPE